MKQKLLRQLDYLGGLPGDREHDRHRLFVHVGVDRVVGIIDVVAELADVGEEARPVAPQLPAPTKITRSAPAICSAALAIKASNSSLLMLLKKERNSLAPCGSDISPRFSAFIFR
ncbi:hypothetical protein ACSZNY_04365 [Aeromonas caviae]